MCDVLPKLPLRMIKSIEKNTGMSIESIRRLSPEKLVKALKKNRHRQTVLRLPNGHVVSVRFHVEHVDP